MAARTGLGLLCLVAACSGHEASDVDGTTPSLASSGGRTTTNAAVPAVPQPADNPSSAEKIALGRLLFFDPILSGDRDIACSSCHEPALAYTDGLAISIGTGGAQAAREALTILDTAWNGRTTANPSPDPDQAPMFWDSRARSLENQATGPLTGENEMRGTHYTEDAIFPELVARLGAIPEYASRFANVFGDSDAVNQRNIVCAIASFERTLTTRPSLDTGNLSAAAKRGQNTFNRLGCARCHSGPMLSDYALHRFTPGGEAIRTPSLRNATRTAPYMHDGRASTLDGVDDIYRRVDRNADPNFRNLRAPDRGDADEITAFLQAASDGDYDRTVPDSVPSGLPVGGPRRNTVP